MTAVDDAPAAAGLGLGAQVKQAFTDTFALIRHPKSALAGAAALPIAVVLLHGMLDTIADAGIGVVFPDIRREFDLTLSEITRVGTIAGVLALLVGIPLGYRTDRTRNRIWWLSGGAAIAAVFFVLTGFAGTVAWFIAGRFLLGLGLKANDPVQSSLLADYTPLQARPAVYSSRGVLGSIGKVIGPVAFGVIATAANWRWAFAFAAVLALAVAIISLRLKDPPRGVQERLAMGVDQADAEIEEEHPRFEEAFQTLKGVGTVRRLWYATPFISGGLVSVGFFVPLYLEEIFGLNAAERGVALGFNEPFAVLGLILGIPIATRALAGRTPQRLFYLLGAAAAMIAVVFVGYAVAPNVATFVALSCVANLIGSVLLPGLATALSLILPPRARGLGFAISSLWAIPGILMLIPMGVIGDDHGARWAIGLGAPIFLTGAIILGSAGTQFRADMLRARLASLASLEVKRAREAGKPKMLVCRGVTVHYGQVQVLFGVDFDVDEGEMVALLGTNGAGKSTLLRAISGTVLPSNGAILLDGRDITRAGPALTAELGIVQMPGGRSIFPTLSVKENLEVATWLYKGDRKAADEAVEHVLELFPILRQKLDDVAGNLSGGQQQMLGLGQAFICRPRLLMIDELSLGLAPTIVQQLLDIVRAIHAQGTTVVLVEQSVNVALSLCERAIFMEKGEVRFEGRTADLLEREDVLRSVFLEGAASAIGGDDVVDVTDAAGHAEQEDVIGHALQAATGSSATTRPRLDVDALAAAGWRPVVALEVAEIRKRFGGIAAVDGVSFKLHQGEILGLIGANGAGKTTILDLISGFLPLDGGRVLLDGQDVSFWTPDARARARLGRSFQAASLFPSLTVKEAIAVALERHIPLRDPFTLAFSALAPAAKESELAVDLRVEELIELMGIGAFRDKFVSELSTGSRRIVDIACSLAHDPKVLLLDEPSSGIAQRETEQLGPLLLRIQQELGASLLVIEHDMPLITSVADRLVALELGQVITVGTPDEVINHPQVVASYLGMETEAAVIERSGAPTKGGVA
jgi:ABC-type branched-subunit amino acid transport system ATPase component/sugar phosphate permease